MTERQKDNRAQIAVIGRDGKGKRRKVTIWLSMGRRLAE